jgi:hypothetical protein
MPAAPAPITTISASRGSGAPHAAVRSAGATASAADADRKLRRVIVMTWFPKTLKSRRNTEEQLVNLPHPGVGGNRHGESIMIDPPDA